LPGTLETECTKSPECRNRAGRLTAVHYLWEMEMGMGNKMGDLAFLKSGKGGIEIIFNLSRRV